MEQETLANTESHFFTYRWQTVIFVVAFMSFALCWWANFRGNELVVFGSLVLIRFVGLGNSNLAAVTFVFAMTVLFFPAVFLEDIARKFETSDGSWNVFNLLLPFLASSFIATIAYLFSVANRAGNAWRQVVFEVLVFLPGIAYSMVFWSMELSKS